MLVGLGENFIYDLLTIAGVMTLVFRDLSAGLILLVPSVFPVMIVFGLMGWFGVTIDVGTIMTPTVALGVSVDDVVHFLIWYRRGLSEGKTRPESVMLAYERMCPGNVSKLERAGSGTGRLRPQFVRPHPAFRGDDVLPADGCPDRQSADPAGRPVQSDRGAVRPQPDAQRACSPGSRSSGRRSRGRWCRGTARRTIRLGTDSRALPKPATSPVMASAVSTGLRTGNLGPLGSTPMGPTPKTPPSSSTRHDAPHRSANR